MTVLAHGGIPGLIAETSAGLVVLVLLGGIWLRERRRRARGGRLPQARMRE